MYYGKQCDPDGERVYGFAKAGQASIWLRIGGSCREPISEEEAKQHGAYYRWGKENPIPFTAGGN